MFAMKFVLVAISIFAVHTDARRRVLEHTDSEREREAGLLNFTPLSVLPARRHYRPPASSVPPPIPARRLATPWRMGQPVLAQAASAPEVEGVLNGHIVNSSERTTAQDVRTLLSLLAPDRPRVAAAYAALVLAATGEAFLPALKASALNAALGVDDTISLRTALTRLGVTGAALTACTGIRGWLFFTCGARAVSRLRARVFAKLVHKSQAFHDEQGAGTLSTRLASDTNQLFSVLSVSVNLVLRQALQALIAVVVAIRIDARLAAAAVAGSALRVAWTQFYSGITRRIAVQQQDNVASSSNVAETCISLIKTVRAYGNEDEESERYCREVDKWLALEQRRSKLYGCSRLVNGGINMATLVSVLALGALLVHRGVLPRESLTSFMLYVSFISDSSMYVADEWGRMKEAFGASSKVLGYLEANGVGSPNKTDDLGISLATSGLEPPASEAQAVESSSVAVPGKRGALSFSGVDFAYPSRPGTQVFSNLSLSVQAGELVAIVGGSGSGKSTIFQVALQFYQPSSGSVRLDGVPVGSIDNARLRSLIAWVQQEPPLFPGRTIRENIAYGLRDLPDEKILAAAKDANAYEFIMQLPDKLDTKIGNAGTSLSGGQKQRIAIARALVRDPALFLLDEATSALDPISEALVQDAIRRVSKQCTIIFTTHKVALARQADRIIVMSDGHIIEQGTHNDLLARGGGYAKLVQAGDDVTEEAAAFVISSAESGEGHTLPS